MALFFLSVAAWLIILRRRRINLEPYRVEDYEPPPVEEPATDSFATEEIERLKVIRDEYFSVIDAIEREQADLKKEYPHASDKRQSAISSKLTSLASRHAAVTRISVGLDSKIDQLYDNLYNGG